MERIVLLVMICFVLAQRMMCSPRETALLIRTITKRLIFNNNLSCTLYRGVCIPLTCKWGIPVLYLVPRGLHSLNLQMGYLSDEIADKNGIHVPFSSVN